MKNICKLETHLKDICFENPEYEDLWATWQINKRSYTSILKTVTQNYPHYTEHDESHSQTIVTNIELLMGRENIGLLSPSDTWMLLQAAYVHDLGMAIMYHQIKEDWADEKFQRYLSELEESKDESLQKASNYLKQLKDNLKDENFEKSWPVKVRSYTTQIIADYYRRYHSQMSKNYIEQLDKVWNVSLESNGLIQKRIIYLLGEVAFLHTQGREEVMKLDYIANGHNADYIHPRFIAEMIRLGDLLDADNNRYNPYLQQVVDKIPKISGIHIEKHKSIKHLLITPEKIEIKTDCNTSEVYREIRNLIEWIKCEIDFVTKEWSKIVPEYYIGCAPKLEKAETLYNGKKEAGDLQFRISQERAFDIIEGSNVYKDKYIFIREMIQNAADASKIQLWRDLKNGRFDGWIGNNVKTGKDVQFYQLNKEIFQSYPIQISIVNLENCVQVTVSDHGIGMSKDIISEMCNVGESYQGRNDSKKEIEDMPEWLKPTAGFGIGLQSIFLITERFTIHSKSQKDQILANVESRKHGGFVQVLQLDGERKQGTDITLEIEDTHRFSYTFGGEVFQYFQEVYDPFDEKDLALAYKLVDVIRDNCCQCYFPLSISIDGHQIEMLSGIKMLDNTYEHETNEYKYSFVSDEWGHIKVWDKRNFAFADINISNDSRCRDSILFKGIYLSKANLRDDRFLNVEMDLYGLSTKKNITLNRDDLTKNGYKVYGRLKDKIVSFALKKIVEKFLNEDSNENVKEKSIAFWCAVDSNNRKLIREKLTDICSKDAETKCKVYRIKEGNYKTEYVPFTDVLKGWETIYYYNYNDLGKKEYMESEEDIDKLICECLDEYTSEERIKPDIILADEDLTNACRDYTVKEFILLCESIKKKNKPMILFKANIEQAADCINCLDELHENEQRFLMEKLIMHSHNGYRGVSITSQRTSIPSFKPYERIMVDGVPGGLSRTSLPGIGYIVSPFRYRNRENCESMQLELFVETVIKHDNFNRMLDFVYNNQVSKRKYSKEEMVETYTALISKYWELFHAVK